MSRSAPEPPDEALDQVLEEVQADHGVTAQKVSRNGHEECQEVVKIHGRREDRFSSLDGEKPKTVERSVPLAEFPEENAFEVLVGLAELYGHRMEEK